MSAQALLDRFVFKGGCTYRVQEKDLESDGLEYRLEAGFP
jgi:hypothetical protein